MWLDPLARWWNENLKGETLYSKKNLPPRQSVHFNWNGLSGDWTRGLGGDQEMTNRFSYDMALGFCHTSIYRASFQPISVSWPVCISTHGNNQNIHTEMNHHTQIADLVRVKCTDRKAVRRTDLPKKRFHGATGTESLYNVLGLRL
jgi:hypothetical protein